MMASMHHRAASPLAQLVARSDPLCHTLQKQKMSPTPSSFRDNQWDGPELLNFMISERVMKVKFASTSDGHQDEILYNVVI